MLLFTTPSFAESKVNTHLKACPDKPNCVSSLAENQSQRVSALQFLDSQASAKVRLKCVIDSLPRTKLIKEDGNYLYYTVTTLILRFVDDLEFYFDEDEKLIQVRSASRTGYSDFNVNRKRVENIRQLFQLAQ